MIALLVRKYQKPIAVFLNLLFYIQILSPALAAIGHPEREWGPGLSARNFSKAIIHQPDFSGGKKDYRTIDKVTGFKKSIKGKDKENGINNGTDKFNKTDIGGPGQPEMSSFQSVNANNTVDLFTGDFSYNIPLMDVGGYPVNIHYSSGISMDQEASWVGLGWNINPGTVSRSMRGLPDDFNGTDTIARTQNIKVNKTVGVSIPADIEIVGLPIGLSANYGVFHNNYNGWGIEYGINASINSGGSTYGSLTAKLGIANNSQTGLEISPSLGISLEKKGLEDVGRGITMGLSTNYSTRTGISALQLSAEVRTGLSLAKDTRVGTLVSDGNIPLSGAISFAVPSYTPTISMPFTNTSYSFTAKVSSEHWVVHPTPISISGYVTNQQIKPEDRKQSIPAVGYLYYTQSNNRSNALMDFNREKESQFNYKTSPFIALPQYSYDIYSISGEGTGGMFRPYRGDVGYIKDHSVRTKSLNDKFSIDLGFGTLFHGGVDFNYSNATTQSGGWESSNDMNQYIHFRNNDTTFQSVYFRNPGEKTSNTKSYYQSIGDDALLRVKLSGTGSSLKASNVLAKYKNAIKTGEIAVSSPIVKKERDKRSQVISYLTASEASSYGLDKSIISYKENTIPVGSCADTTTIIPRVDNVLRKGHHISEVDILNGDGRRYVYGIPAYNVEQKDVTFAVNKETNTSDINKGLVNYTPGLDNSVQNNKGKDNYFSQDSMPGYTHSFLLTAVLSPDYVDIKNDGITQDDPGDAVKFNYSRIYGNNNSFYEWRAPLDSNKANYNEGFKTYSRDDKGTYLYGKKEIWYLNSIESKTMVAVFKVASDRQDVYSVAGENGGLNTTKPLRRLKEIDLYAKADLIKNGTSAKAIKTVHFAYSYTLCKGIAGNSNVGKLTLDSIWFTYNGNEKGKLNPYVFRYHPDNNGIPLSDYNPTYNVKNYDRWGNYKDPAENPGTMNNIDYPYSQQDSTKAGKYAAAWTLSDIKLPSGGHMKVTYESDDYGYVQNKRAAQMFAVIGISNSSSQTSGSNLYTTAASDNYCVFIHSDIALTDKYDVFQKYLEGNDYIYYKLSVKMPDDRWGSGNEYIPGYAKISDYGLVTGDAHKFWIRFAAVSGQSPMTRSAIQFLRTNLPSKAYPSSELGDDINFGDAVKMLVSGFREIKNSIEGFDNVVKNKGWCQSVDLSHSFIRLNSPGYKKYGGGLRVKKVEIFDNWNKMTNQKESVYGQEYNYSTTQEVAGHKITISSGVAAYEPMVGAEENPFRVPIEYAEKLAPMGPVNYLFSENPVGETYYPSPMVGYSKVRVRTINKKTRSANGWSETEFFTTRDFPTLVENTLLDNDAKQKYNPVLQNFLRINSIHRVMLSQGFKIELNDMNGKIKRQSSYAENDSVNPVSYVRNYYKTDNNRAFQQHLNNTVWVVDSLNGHIDTTAQVGKDIELMMDMREQVSRTISDNKSINIDIMPGIGIIPIIPIPSRIPLPQREETSFRLAATVKIIQRYGILDSVVAMDKGSVVSTRNLVYDGETGEVLLSRTQNEFNDPIYNFSYPAHWAYSGMGMAYKNVDAVFSGLNLKGGKLYYGSNNLPFPAEKFFESGDEIKLEGRAATLQTGDNCNIFSTSISGVALPKKAWAIDASKGKEKNTGIYFIDENGKPLTGFVDAMRILRSGKRNMLDASAGNIVSMGNPIQQISSGNYRLVFDTTTRVINTAATTYKDLWQVDNSQYQFDSCYTKTVSDSVEIYLSFAKGAFNNGTLLRLKKTVKDNSVLVDDQTPLIGKLVASQNYMKPIKGFLGGKSFNGMDYKSKTILNFDLTWVPFNATVTNAQLFLKGTNPGPLWSPDVFNYRCGLGVFCDIRNFDWFNAGTSYAGSYNTVIKRIISGWNSGTKYNNFGVTTVHQAVISTTPVLGRLTVNCTDLVKDAVTNHLPYYGFMMELQNPSVTNNATNYYSFDNINFGDSVNLLKINYQIPKDTCIKQCRNYINDTSINPYRWGILGNWRVEKAYTFYHDRAENDASTAGTNIRKEGLLKNFSTYWKFTDSILLANPDTSKWVWNSAMSGYNKKGFETENYDPLGRYNAGLYGYNQTLPVAVAQNSKYREVLFDGFEDYGYKTNNCANCDSTRAFDFIKNQEGVSLNQAISHTGKYSMKIDGNKQSVLAVPVTSSTDTLSTQLSMTVDSTAIYAISINGQGTGLTGYYSGYVSGGNCATNPTQNAIFSQTVYNQGPVNYYWGSGAPLSGMCNRFYTVLWKGKVQPAYSDYYKFYTSSDAGITVKLNGSAILTTTTGNALAASGRIYLQAGGLYDIEVKYFHNNGNTAQMKLQWSRDQSPSVLPVPQALLYKYGAIASDSAGSVISTVRYYCIKFNNPKPQKIIRPVFSPIQNSRMVISAWVRIDGDDCTTVPPQDNVILVNFNPSGTNIALQKTGVRIEGWQRYETVLTIPYNATQLYVTIAGVNNHTIDVDDIRLQPYNSSLKSFVYDPVTLRLMGQLDENNYATFYEYDDDGTLIRVKKETERGIMTIQETRSALLKDNN